MPGGNIRRIGLHEVSIAPWKHPNSSVLPFRGGTSQATISPASVSKPYSFSYKVQYPSTVPQPTDDEESDASDAGSTVETPDEADAEFAKENTNDGTNAVPETPADASIAVAEAKDESDAAEPAGEVAETTTTPPSDSVEASPPETSTSDVVAESDGSPSNADAGAEGGTEVETDVDSKVELEEDATVDLQGEADTDADVQTSSHEQNNEQADTAVVPQSESPPADTADAPSVDPADAPPPDPAETPEDAPEDAPAETPEDVSTVVEVEVVESETTETASEPINKHDQPDENNGEEMAQSADDETINEQTNTNASSVDGDDCVAIDTSSETPIKDQTPISEATQPSDDGEHPQNSEATSDVTEEKCDPLVEDAIVSSSPEEIDAADNASQRSKSDSNSSHGEEKKVSFQAGTPEPKPTIRKKNGSKASQRKNKKLIVLDADGHTKVVSGRALKTIPAPTAETSGVESVVDDEPQDSVSPTVVEATPDHPTPKSSRHSSKKSSKSANKKQFVRKHGEAAKLTGLGIVMASKTVADDSKVASDVDDSVQPSAQTQPVDVELPEVIVEVASPAEDDAIANDTSADAQDCTPTQSNAEDESNTEIETANDKDEEHVEAFEEAPKNTTPDSNDGEEVVAEEVAEAETSTQEPLPPQRVDSGIENTEDLQSEMQKENDLPTEDDSPAAPPHDTPAQAADVAVDTAADVESVVKRNEETAGETTEGGSLNEDDHLDPVTADQSAPESASEPADGVLSQAEVDAQDTETDVVETHTPVDDLDHVSGEDAGTSDQTVSSNSNDAESSSPDNQDLDTDTSVDSTKHEELAEKVADKVIAVTQDATSPEVVGNEDVPVAPIVTDTNEDAEVSTESLSETTPTSASEVPENEHHETEVGKEEDLKEIETDKSSNEDLSLDPAETSVPENDLPETDKDATGDSPAADSLAPSEIAVVEEAIETIKERPDTGQLDSVEEDTVPENLDSAKELARAKDDIGKEQATMPEGCSDTTETTNAASPTDAPTDAGESSLDTRSPSQDDPSGNVPESTASDVEDAAQTDDEKQAASDTTAESADEPANIEAEAGGTLQDEGKPDIEEITSEEPSNTQKVQDQARDCDETETPDDSATVVNDSTSAALSTNEPEVETEMPAADANDSVAASTPEAEDILHEAIPDTAQSSAPVTTDHLAEDAAGQPEIGECGDDVVVADNDAPPELDQDSAAAPSRQVGEVQVLHEENSISEPPVMDCGADENCTAVGNVQNEDATAQPDEASDIPDDPEVGIASSGKPEDAKVELAEDELVVADTEVLSEERASSDNVDDQKSKPAAVDQDPAVEKPAEEAQAALQEGSSSEHSNSDKGASASIVEAPPLPTVDKAKSRRHHHETERTRRRHSTTEERTSTKHRSSDKHKSRSSKDDKIGDGHHHRSQEPVRSLEEEAERRARKEARKALEMERLRQVEERNAYDEEIKRIRKEARRAAQKAAAEEAVKIAREEAEMVRRERDARHRRQRDVDEYMREPRHSYTFTRSRVDSGVGRAKGSDGVTSPTKSRRSKDTTTSRQNDDYPDDKPRSDTAGTSADGEKRDRHRRASETERKREDREQQDRSHRHRRADRPHQRPAEDGREAERTSRTSRGEPSSKKSGSTRASKPPKKGFLNSLLRGFS